MTKGPHKMSFRADRLKQARKLRQMSQKELATMVGVGLRTMGSYEQGISNPDSNVLSRMVKALRVSADYLLGNVNKPTEHLAEVDPQALALAVSIMELPEGSRNAIIGIVQSMKQSRRQK